MRRFYMSRIPAPSLLWGLLNCQNGFNKRDISGCWWRGDTDANELPLALCALRTVAAFSLVEMTTGTGTGARRERLKLLQTPNSTNGWKGQRANYSVVGLREQTKTISVTAISYSPVFHLFWAGGQGERVIFCEQGDEKQSDNLGKNTFQQTIRRPFTMKNYNCNFYDMIFFSLDGTPAGTCEFVEPTKYV